jgi:hypothetical protein
MAGTWALTGAAVAARMAVASAARRRRRFIQAPEDKFYLKACLSAGFFKLGICEFNLWDGVGGGFRSLDSLDGDSD